MRFRRRQRRLESFDMSHGMVTKWRPALRDKTPPTSEPSSFSWTPAPTIDPVSGFAIGSSAAGADEPEITGESWFDAHAAEDVRGQMQALEERLDRMLHLEHIATQPNATTSSDRAMSHASTGAAAEKEATEKRLEVSDPRARSQRRLLASPFFLRHWSPQPHRNPEPQDGYGLDPEFERRVIPFLDLLYRKYFRVEHEGLERVPKAGRCLLVANHSGTVPLDGLMLRTLMRLEHPTRRPLRWLSEDFVHQLPFVGTAASRLGAVRACQENGERLLREDEALLAAFPEGLKGIGKLYRERYRLQRFGRGGFVRLALRTQSPIVPCAIVGAEETAPMVYRLDYLPRLLGLPYLPVTPTFPWLGPFGLIPAPTKWKIAFAAPIDLSDYGPEAEHDHLLVGQLSQRVRSEVQRLLDGELARRRNVWKG